MIPLLFSVALLNVGVSTSGDPESGSTLPLPDPPETHVLDRMEWLSEERRLKLDHELERVHDEHGLDLFVVVWDRRLPDGEGPEDFARRIGSSWNRGRIWGVVFLTPGSISTPYVVTGGPQLTTDDTRHLHAAAVYSREFGARAWNDQERLQQTTLTLTEELVFAAHAIAPPGRPTAGPVAAAPPVAGQRSTIPAPVLVAAGSLGVLLLLVILYALRRRQKSVPTPEEPSAQPAPEPVSTPVVRTFDLPETPTSLGASWSGASTLHVAVPESPA